MRKLKCIVIDDEPLACKGLAEYISEVDALQMIAAVNSPQDALNYLHATDLMYLDINMPKVSGIDFLQQVKKPPLTIITTAYQQYALQGFELDVVDYLLKPISFPRFIKATNKAIDYFRLSNAGKEEQGEGFFFVKSNGILEKIYIQDIIAVESLANYVTIYCTSKKLVVYLTLKQVKDYLPSSGFIQVHKSYIAAKAKIEKVDSDSIFVSGKEIPVGSSFRDDLLKEIEGRILRR
jgi:DNA-binding LytR/AlgR family response regulator